MDEERSRFLEQRRDVVAHDAVPTPRECGHERGFSRLGPAREGHRSAVAHHDAGVEREATLQSKYEGHDRTEQIRRGVLDAQLRRPRAPYLATIAAHENPSAIGVLEREVPGRLDLPQGQGGDSRLLKLAQVDRTTR